MFLVLCSLQSASRSARGLGSRSVTGSGVTSSGPLLPQSPQLPQPRAGSAAPGHWDHLGKGRRLSRCKTRPARCGEALLALGNRTKRSRGSRAAAPCFPVNQQPALCAGMPAHGREASGQTDPSIWSGHL